MGEVIDYAIVLLLLIGFTYGLVKQIQNTLTIQKEKKTGDYKRELFGNYIASISFVGFLLSYLFNILVALQIIQSNIITSNNTGGSSMIFLVILFIAKYGIIPKNSKGTRFLK